MPIVPLTGQLSLSQIRQAVIDAGGTPPSTPPYSFSGIKNAATFSKFHPSFLDGATSLADIKHTEQFRGYPSGDIKSGSLRFLLHIDYYNLVNNPPYGHTLNIDVEMLDAPSGNVIEEAVYSHSSTTGSVFTQFSNNAPINSGDIAPNALFGFGSFGAIGLSGGAGAESVFRIIISHTNMKAAYPNLSKVYFRIWRITSTGSNQKGVNIINNGIVQYYSGEIANSNHPDYSGILQVSGSLVSTETYTESSNIPIELPYTIY